MSRRLPLRDPIGYELRRSRAQRRVGFGAVCSWCGEDRPEALIPGSKPLICAECQREAQGQATMDLHHVSGRANDSLTIPVPANDHRAELSTAMMDWPKETRENPDASPLLATAGRIRGHCDLHVYLLESLLLPSAELLEHLHSYLSTTFGDEYWTTPNSRLNRSRGQE